MREQKFLPASVLVSMNCNALDKKEKVLRNFISQRLADEYKRTEAGIPHSGIIPILFNWDCNIVSGDLSSSIIEKILGDLYECGYSTDNLTYNTDGTISFNIYF